MAAATTDHARLLLSNGQHLEIDAPPETVEKLLERARSFAILTTTAGTEIRVAAQHVISIEQTDSTSVGVPPAAAPAF
jgi:hypothetical protein